LRLNVATSLLFPLIFLIVFSSVSVYAQDGEGENEDPLQPVWDAIHTLQDAVGSLWDTVASIPNTVEGFINWLWGSVVNFVNWLWNQIYVILIMPVVNAWKAAWVDLKTIFIEPLNSFRYWMTVQAPSFFTRHFGVAAPLVMTLIAVGVAFGLYIVIKIAIQLL